MTREEKADIRRENLRRLIQRDYQNNQSKFARAYAEYYGRDPKPNQFSDVLRPGGKGFGEELATNVELAVGLKTGEMSKANSALERLRPLHKPAEELRAELDTLDPDEQRRVREFILELRRTAKPAKRRVTK